MILGCFCFNRSNNLSDYGLLRGLTLRKFETGYFLFDEEKSRFCKQLLVIKTDSNLEIVNPLDINFPVGFSSLYALEEYLREEYFSFKMSIIIYDADSGEITLTRDLFGVRPLYYIHILNNFFAFSSSLTALLKLDIVRSYRSLNISSINNYLEWSSDGSLYSSDTFYNDIKNAQPGKSLLINPNHSYYTDFWVFNPLRWVPLKSKEEFGEEFKVLLKSSVRDSLRNSTSVASTLSGGLDSSSICCLIKMIKPEISIHTIYAETSTSLTEESNFAISVAEQINSKHHIITPPLDNLFESSVLHTSLYGHPEYMLNGSSLNRSVIHTALESKCTTLFSGHAGDSIVGYGGDFIFNLFNEGKWNRLKEIFSAPTHQSLRYNDEKTESDLVKELLFALLLRKRESLKTLELALLVGKVSRFFKIPLQFFIAKGLTKMNTYFSIPSNISSRQVSHNPQSKANYQFPLYRGTEDIYANQYDSVFGIQSVLINEQFHTLDNYYGTRHEFPFYDKSLFELCLFVPSEVKYDNGLRRGHFREAMKGVLPENVRTRVSKANFGLYGRITALKLYEQSQDLLTYNNEVWDFVEKSKFDKCVKILVKDNLPVHYYNKVNYFVTKTIYLAIWLDILKKDGFISGFL